MFALRANKASSFLVCFKRGVANRSRDWRDTPGRSNSGQPNAAGVGRYGHTRVSRMKSHNGFKGISTCIEAQRHARYSRSAGLGFKCFTELEVNLN